MRKQLRQKNQPVDLDVTAFMNLMVILVPCLLSLAVFTHISILELKIPRTGSASTAEPQQPSEPPLSIEITLRNKIISVSDNRMGVIKSFPQTEGKHDLPALSRLLQNMKDKVPDKKDIILLVEQDVSYEAVVHTMETLRLAKVGVGFGSVSRELFPDIALGDAQPQP